MKRFHVYNNMLVCLVRMNVVHLQFFNSITEMVYLIYNTDKCLSSGPLDAVTAAYGAVNRLLNV